MNTRTQFTFQPIWQWPIAHQLIPVLLLSIGTLAVSSFIGWRAHKEQSTTKNHLQAELDKWYLQRQNNNLLPDQPASVPPPSSATLSALGAGLVAQAEQTGLRVSQWTLGPTQRDKEWHKAQLSVQLQGPYAPIKGWLGQTLQAQPWMALDSLQWRLSEVGSGMLEAQVRMSVFVQD